MDPPFFCLLLTESSPTALKKGKTKTIKGEKKKIARTEIRKPILKGGVRFKGSQNIHGEVRLGM